MTEITPTVTVTEAALRLGATATPTPLLVDVREPDEYRIMRVPGAVSLPLSVLAVRLEELPRDRPLLLLCAAGARSARATDMLLTNGYAGAVNVAGGISAWSAAGLPVRTGPLAPGEGALV